ncbi:hypothetical protein [Parabacteroides chinchillae]|uniref:Uncharacterized protein n=1 Tax=Parabacteroides chinchillae TaxID=871327 RepID=A0A8G2BYD2_9BACT|nr:hypothetical protein [Parabacteroides chinchillae]SEG17895.1 hypothetical protein SAMN05444001_11851 [Parabacteroides chinchillae]
MKRFYTLFIIALFASPPIYGQGFLKKLGKKAQEISKTVLGEDEKQKEKEAEEIDYDFPPAEDIYPEEMYAEEEAEAPTLGSTDPNAPRILTFSIGKEKGKIDHKKGIIEITVDPDTDFENIIPVYTTGSNVTSSPASGKRIGGEDSYFTVKDKAGRKCVYEVVLHIRGMEKKDLKAGTKSGTLRMVNTMQGFPQINSTYYFDNYGKLFAMMNDMGTGTIYDYAAGKVTILTAVASIEKVRRITDQAASLQIPDIKEPTMKDLENALNNGLKDVEFVYFSYEIPGLDKKLECPIISNYEVMPPSFLVRMNARKVANTTIAGKSCFTLEITEPESGMKMLYYSWKNINFGGGIKGMAWSQVESFKESTPAGIFSPPKGYRPYAEYQAEVDAITEAAGKKLQKKAEPLMNAPEIQAIKQFLDEYEKELKATDINK